MRADMDKVIVERPRYGSRLPSRKKGYRRYVQSTPVEELPRREPLPGRWHGMDRQLNEHLGPMRRFLRSNVGRPWNKVHQDLCEHISFANAVQSHVLDHIDDYVHRYVEVVDSSTVFCRRPLWWYRRQLCAGDMYVCPKTGILKTVRKDRRGRPPEKVNGNAGVQYLRRDDAWWEVRLRKRPEIPGQLWDPWLERDVASLSEQDCIAAYGGRLIATSKRPLSRTETRKLYRAIRNRNRRTRNKRPPRCRRL